MVVSRWLAAPRRSTILRSLGAGGSLLLLSSLFLPWLLLPFEANFRCGFSPIPSSCPAEGEEAAQVSLWQVFTTFFGT
jgi:hypothetical protein